MEYDSTVCDTDMKYLYIDKCTSEKISPLSSHRIIQLDDKRIMGYGDNGLGQLGMGK